MYLSDEATVDIQDNYDKVYDMTGESNGTDVSCGSIWTDEFTR